jgi:hypothetical protein
MTFLQVMAERFERQDRPSLRRFGQCDVERRVAPKIGTPRPDILHLRFPARVGEKTNSYKFLTLTFERAARFESSSGRSFFDGTMNFESCETGYLPLSRFRLDVVVDRDERSTCRKRGTPRPKLIERRRQTEG